MASCVRYIPTRQEINRPYGDDPSIQYVGEDAFFRYDREQQERLNKLIRQRLANAKKSFDNRYRLGAGDVLTIEVKNFEEISKEYRVQPSGTIQLPFVGSLKVANKDEKQVVRLIESKIADYVLEPQVHVEITDYSAHKVWVIGGSPHINNNNSNSKLSTTNSRRAFPLRRPNYSLVELLVETGNIQLSDGGVIYFYPEGALHQGSLNKRELSSMRTSLSRTHALNQTQTHNRTLTHTDCSCENEPCESAHARNASLPVERKYSPKARIQIDLEDLFGGIREQPLFVPLRPGDAIYIPPSQSVQVYGEVASRGSYRVSGSGGGGNGGIHDRSDIKPSLFSVIAASRGFTYSADIHNVEIFRELEYGKKVVLTVDFEDLVLRRTQDIRLRNGDIVWVPSQSKRFVQNHTINAINQLIGTGSSVQNVVTND